MLNATSKLGLVPKAFHQPSGEPALEARLSRTLQREFEEELLGRADLEQIAHEGARYVDPFHSQHLTEPMTWLLDNPHSRRVKCTGLGFNTVTSNYDFASLIVIDDEDRWGRFGGMGREQPGSRPCPPLLIPGHGGRNHPDRRPPLGQRKPLRSPPGIRRLTEIYDPDRVALPTVEVDD